MGWAKRRGIPVVVMSESTQWDEPRVFWKEIIKSRVVRLASAALVGGTPHAKYIVQLGMQRDQVVLGYDVVDNDYFTREAEMWRSHVTPNSSKKYFLSSNRFIAKKNLDRILEAYTSYIHASVSQLTDPWNLCMLGDGELKGELLQQCHKLGLKVVACAPWEASSPEPSVQENVVYFPGFRQIDELPRFYGQAGAFVHASSTEQWGLVVNEAMASGLPVIVSDRVGCADDLVKIGLNGYTFDFSDVNALSGLMTQVSRKGFPLVKFGLASLNQISNWGLDRFGIGFKAAMEIASNRPKRSFSLLDQILIKVLTQRNCR
jgi:glycosyltransferase involved in cell wall biosynthesis